jgi:hypothetical protein
VYTGFTENVYNNLIIVSSSISSESSREILKTSQVQTLPDVRQVSVPHIFCQSNSIYVGIHTTTYETNHRILSIYTGHVFTLNKNNNPSIIVLNTVEKSM